MADGDNSYPIVHPSIQREIDHVRSEARAIGRQAASDCEARHRRQNEDFLPLRRQANDDHETLIELVGKHGNTGRVGALDKSITGLENDYEDLATQQKSDHDDLVKIKSGQLRYSAAGAAGGGSLLVGLIELLRHFA